MKTLTIRLKPGEDIVTILEKIAQTNHLEAACVLTCVGSLRKAVLRFANQEMSSTLEGPFEIVSLTGVFSIHGGHFHIAVSDGEGKTYGAHLVEGSEVYTTAEIVFASFADVRFLRAFDPQTGYPELDIQPNS